MSRTFFRRRSGMLTGDLVQDPVSDIAALRALSARDAADGQMVLVRQITQIYAFSYGNTDADDGDLVIAPTHEPALGRWLKVTTPIPEVSLSLSDLEDVEVSGADDGDLLSFDLGTGLWVPFTLTDLEAEEEVTFTGDVAVEGELTSSLGLGSGYGGGVFVGARSESDLSVADMTGTFSVKLGTREVIPNGVSSRLDITLGGVVGVIGSPVAQLSVGFNLSDSAGVTAGLFITGNLGDALGLPAAHNSEVTVRISVLFGPATNGSPVHRNVHVSGTCIQDRSGTINMSSMRRFTTGPPPGPAAYGQGLTLENLAITNDRVQLSIETSTNTQNLANHYEFSPKLIVINASRGS
jgi:hypothetical protein